MRPEKDLFPVGLEDHHRAIGPAESLFLVFLEIPRRQSFAEGVIDVDDAVAAALDTKSEFGILADETITPFFGFERRSSKEAHGAIHDDSVRFVADDHPLFIEEIELVGHDLLECGRSHDAVCLRTLDGGDMVCFEEPDRHSEPVRVDTVVRIQESDDPGFRMGEFERFVEGSGLVPLQCVEMIESYIVLAESMDELLDRFPDRFIAGIVLDDDELVIGVMEPGDVFDRTDQHLRFFVIAGDMDRDERFGSGQRGELIQCEVMAYFSAAHDLQVVSELVEDAGDREEHEGDIDPELGEIEVMPDPGFVADHHDDVGQSEKND